MQQYCIQLKPIDLPLSTTGTYTHFTQIGQTSQLKLLLGLKQSEKLMAEHRKLQKKKLGELQEQGASKNKELADIVSPEEEQKRAAAEVMNQY